MASTRRLKNKADYHLQRSVHGLQNGNPAAALSHSDEQLKLLARLRKAEPEEDEHLRMEASAYYNRAGILDQLGRVAQAVEAARGALERYTSLAAHAVIEQPQLDVVWSPAAKREQMTTTLFTADVQARLARLIAKNGGSEAEARVLGESALATYEWAAKAYPVHASELERIFIQVATARDTIARAHLAAEDLSGAIARWDELLAECVDRLGTSHPVTINVRGALEAARRLA